MKREETNRRKTVKRYILLMNSIGNFSGAIMVYTFISFISFGRGGEVFSINFQEVIIAFLVILFLVLFGTIIEQKRERAMWSWYLKGAQQDPPLEVADLALRLPVNSAFMTMRMWLFAGFLSFFFTSLAARSVSLHSFLTFFLGIGLIPGFIASTLIYFANERAWMPEIRCFYPSGKYPRGKILKVPFKIKIFILLLAQMVPLFLLGVISLNLLQQDHHTVMVYLIPLTIGIGIIQAILFSQTLGATMVNSVKTLVTEMERVRWGDFQVQVPLSSSDELGELSIGFKEMVEGLHHLKGSIEKARAIHKTLLPSSYPEEPGLSFTSYYLPADTLGGDFYNIIKVEGGVLLYLADVTGHGLDGAMLNIFLRETINSYLKRRENSEKPPSPQRIISHVAQVYHQENFEEDYFICLFIGVFQRKNHKFTFSDAGFQVPPFIVNHEGLLLDTQCGGLPISTAIDRDLMDFGEEEILLPPGSTVLLTTDGLIEEERGEAMYSEERLRSIFLQNHFFPVERLKTMIIDDFISFAGTLQGKDDITLLLMKNQETID